MVVCPRAGSVRCTPASQWNRSGNCRGKGKHWNAYKRAVHESDRRTSSGVEIGRGLVGHSLFARMDVRKP